MDITIFEWTTASTCFRNKFKATTWPQLTGNWNVFYTKCKTWPSRTQALFWCCDGCPVWSQGMLFSQSGLHFVRNWMLMDSALLLSCFPAVSAKIARYGERSVLWVWWRTRKSVFYKQNQPTRNIQQGRRAQLHTNKHRNQCSSKAHGCSSHRRTQPPACNNWGLCWEPRSSRHRCSLEDRQRLQSATISCIEWRQSL